MLLSTADGQPSASIILTRPEDGGYVPDRFDLGFELIVDGDHRSFSKSHSDSKLCLSLDGAAPSCSDLFATGLGVSGLSLGPHVLEAWVQAADESVVVGPALSHFRVLDRPVWRAWLAAGGLKEGTSAAAAAASLAAIAEDKALVAPPLLTWHAQQLAEVDGVQAGTMGPRSPWRCDRPHKVPVELMVGIKSYALGFPARHALRSSWLAALGENSGICAW